MRSNWLRHARWHGHMQVEVVISTIFQGCDKVPKAIRASNEHRVDWLIHASVLKQTHASIFLFPGDHRTKFIFEINQVSQVTTMEIQQSLPLSNPSIYKIDPMAWMRPLSDVCDASWVKYYLLIFLIYSPTAGI
jgi:hypothetical protein